MTMTLDELPLNMSPAVTTPSVRSGMFDPLSVRAPGQQKKRWENTGGLS